MSYYKDKKVLVTGATGLIGSNLVEMLSKAGAKVTACIHNQSPRRLLDSVQYVSRDLTLSDECWYAVEGQQIIFHCAANTSGAVDTIHSPMVHVTPNVVMNTWMLDAAYHAGVEKFVFFSSTTGYPDTDQPVKEDEMFDGPLFEKYFFVGSMKRFTETLCIMYGQKLPRKMATIVVRPSNVYGPGDKFDYDRCHVTSALIRRVVERHTPIEVWGTGNDVRDLIYVDDMVEGAMLAAEKTDQYDVFNIGSGTGVSVRQILATLLRVEDFVGVPEYHPEKPTMIPIRLMDVAKAERLLGFKAKTSLEDGLRKTIAWYRSELK